MFIKKIIFDARHISNEFSGLGRYSINLLEGLLAHIDEVSSLIVLVESSIDESNSLYRKLKSLSSAHQAIEIDLVPIKVFSMKHYFGMRKYLKKYPEHEYFYPHFDLPFGIINRTQFVIHDLFPLIVKGYIVRQALLKKVIFYGLCLHSLLGKRVKCVAISESTNKDIRKYFPFVSHNKIRTVHSSSCLAIEDNSDISVAEVPPYLFYIGDRRPHKNLKKMIDIFKVLKDRHAYRGKFLIAGSTKNFDLELENYISDKPYIELIGIVSDKELNSYYRGMESLFFLSKYEGFGLPILEAASFNKKIITSNISSLPEVTPDTGLLLEPTLEVEVLAEDISMYLASNKTIDNSSFISSFSWSKTAKGIFSDSKGA
ncbi:glycosyltransferase family 4 protein [Psychrobium sp. MM17-31]|uniref:glycosyltransferase family 4 protein n=1 Tax=Psychrobium sp. MM17-31 TaxID=2917758 RepID=UPI001EF65CB3|nr:glycosyltransferase family 1 protein [Psychrobium sp. MM17-31]MCG7531142.1 glycosyltransferase family 4 protein [Psychrobium sp. MM17-31]